eukprot:7722690-Pyramimonas_sp.AAC.1
MPREESAGQVRSPHGARCYFPRLAKWIPGASRADVFFTFVRINVAGARLPGFVLAACLKT